MTILIRTTAEQLVTALEDELAHARASWSVFMCGNGLDATQRKNLHSLISNTFANHTFRHIILASATMTVLSISRLTDPPAKDRFTLMGLKGAIQTNIEPFAAAAENWIDGSDAERKKNRAYVEKGIPKLVSEISQFCRSPEIKNIRSLRDEALAHRLGLKTLRPTFNDIGIAFRKAHHLVSQASSLVKGNIWDPEQFIEVQETYATEFWDAFEKGLQVEKSASK